MACLMASKLLAALCVGMLVAAYKVTTLMHAMLPICLNVMQDISQAADSIECGDHESGGAQTDSKASAPLHSCSRPVCGGA